MSRTSQFLAFAINDFAKSFVKNRAADIRKSDVVNTGALLRSLSARVQADQDRGIYLALIYLKSYGRYTDMKRRYTKAGGTEMIDLLKEWVSEEGIQKFTSNPKYARAYKGLTADQIRAAIAWGIVRRYKAKGTGRRKSWWNKGKTADIENFYDFILRGYAEATVQDLKNMIENGNTQN